MKLKRILKNIKIFIWGCLISSCSFFALFLIEYSDKIYVFNSLINLHEIMRLTAYCLFIATIEEFIFRYLFLKRWIINNEKQFSKRVVSLGLISSIVFGFLHFNMNDFPLMQINLVFSGISLFFATYLFRNMSIAVGMHFSWNFIQGVIFPFDGSGSEFNSILVFKSEVVITPEASQFMFVTFFVEIILIWISFRLKAVWI